MSQGLDPPSGMHAVTPEWLADWLRGEGEPAYRARQVLDWIYQKRVERWDDMVNLPKRLREALSTQIEPDHPQLLREVGSRDTTRKFLWRLRDGRLIESVLIPASPALYGESSDRLTLCVSTQVGCAYGCKFCASGLAGWLRNLQPHEIVGQIVAVERVTADRINNLVFMGMGEPLANYPNLMTALGILNAEWGIHIGARHITISTSGLAPVICKLADQPLPIRLAVSLHGATDEVRERIMPVNRKFPIATLMEACHYYSKATRQIITFEYILIEGINASERDARSLVELASGLRAKVNLIPYNRVEGLEWRRPSEADQERFLAILRRGAIKATLRREKGHDIAAACGQLRLQSERDSGALFAGQTGFPG